MKTKIRSGYIFALIFGILLLSLSCLAGSDGAQNWYFSSKSQNERPTLPNLKSPSAKGIGKEEKVLYLTFDAGYENGNVKKIVDILKEKEVCGAFFVLRHFVDANTELCIEMKKNGNLVCNHTSRHPAISNLSEEDITKEIRGLEAFYHEKTGYEMDRFFRPPEGVWSERALDVVEKLGYKTVFWSLAWADWDNSNQKPPAYAMEKLTTRVHDGAVILLHPTSETNAKILGDFIDQMKEKGYRFGTLDELWEG
ncbi:MAG: polysaccharide deacetylase family protein [Clostridia bacterium]|nr:polysaccharide deacetylase family protein [Clostridia bacterium]